MNQPMLQPGAGRPGDERSAAQSSESQAAIDAVFRSALERIRTRERDAASDCNGEGGPEPAAEVEKRAARKKKGRKQLLLGNRHGASEGRAKRARGADQLGIRGAQDCGGGACSTIDYPMLAGNPSYQHEGENAHQRRPAECQLEFAQALGPCCGVPGDCSDAYAAHPQGQSWCRGTAQPAQSCASRAAPAVWRDENAPHTQEPTRSQLVETLRDLHTALRLSRQREESSLQLIREMRHELQKVYKLLASYDCGLTNACMLSAHGNSQVMPSMDIGAQHEQSEHPTLMHARAPHRQGTRAGLGHSYLSSMPHASHRTMVPGAMSTSTPSTQISIGGAIQNRAVSPDCDTDGLPSTPESPALSVVSRASTHLERRATYGQSRDSSNEDTPSDFSLPCSSQPCQDGTQVGGDLDSSMCDLLTYGR